MNKVWIPALVATVLFSGSAFARNGWQDDAYRDHRRHSKDRVVVHHVYAEPRVVYRPVPVVYRTHYGEDRHERPQYPVSVEEGDQQLVGQAFGAIAGAAIGSQIGQGNGRIAATAIGAVIGAVVGGNLAR